MLLYVMLYIVLAFLMLFAAITNAVCLNNACFLLLFFSVICANAFFFMLCLCLFHFFFNLHHAQCF